MKTYQYLTDGILESYLLGLVSEEQQKDVDHLLETDPELQLQLSDLEQDLEDHFMRHAVPPPPAVRNAVLERISEGEIQKRPREQQSYQRPNFTEGPPRSDYVNVEVDDTHIRVHKYWRPAFIAVFVLSKVFLIAGLYYYFKADSMAAEIARLKAAAEQTSTMSGNRTTPVNP
ncbi:hypothetical protein [Spirosoma sp. KUDC1026]|uniref:hypothetical protein n=1 Tax=Spirosoma sp. KUDC1026 TaxID=2745947 RepID=UPI00159BEC51|nr:hypothetical protein [Spirosoma sp. KUDC1026]QKZ11371.1 hypothetical protein HU175_01445 [Spirosoma sp. KUDC1026]